MDSRQRKGLGKKISKVLLTYNLYCNCFLSILLTTFACIVIVHEHFISKVDESYWRSESAQISLCLSLALSVLFLLGSFVLNIDLLVFPLKDIL